MVSALEGSKWSAARSGRSLPPGKTRYSLYRRLGGPQGRSGEAENLAPTGIRSPDGPACSQSLYRLRYPAHTKEWVSGYLEFQNVIDGSGFLILSTMFLTELDIFTFCIHDSHLFIQFVSIYNLFDSIRHTYPIYE